MTGRATRRATGHVLVAGGGIAGLAAARALVLAGASVTVVEAERLGGKLRTSPFAGRPVDEAADTFLARVPGATELALDVGLGDALVAPAEVPAYLLGDAGELLPIPSEQLLGVPTDLDALADAGICTPAGLARAATDLHAPAGPPLADDMSIGELVRARLGDEVLTRLVDPLVGGINAGHTDHLSLATAAPQLDAAARSGEPSLIRAAAALRARAATAGSGPMFLTPRLGMGHLAEAVAADLSARGVELLVPSTVVAVEPASAGPGWRVGIRGAGAAPTPERTLEVDAVVIATPAPAAARLLTGVAPAAAEVLGGIEHASVALVTLAFDPPDVALPLPGSGFLVPRRAGLLTTACSWSSSKWHHLAPGCGDGTVLLRASAGRIDDRRIDDLDDADLTDAVVTELGSTSGVSGPPRAVRVGRWPGAFPQYGVGHAARIRSANADLAERAPGIVLAGAALAGVGVPACIRSGTAAAAALGERSGS
ncbi:MAG: protoporphyrinogen oxidase [Acidimicrobiia bacterium]|nr:protoporphyrinogen oxidase [Acidimicrobiia bacterium]